MRVTNLLRSLLRWRTENAWHPHAAESVPARPRGTSRAKMAEPRTDAIHRGWRRAHPHRHALPRSNAPGRAAALRRWSPGVPVPVRPRRQIAVHAAVATQPHRHIGRCPGAAAEQIYQADSWTLWAPIWATGAAGLRRPPTICLQVMIGGHANTGQSSRLRPLHEAPMTALLLRPDLTRKPPVFRVGASPI